MNSENESRKTVITGMAKAIVKINKQPITDTAIKQVLGKAAETFADTRREEATWVAGLNLPMANGHRNRSAVNRVDFKYSSICGGGDRNSSPFFVLKYPRCMSRKRRNTLIRLAIRSRL